MIVQNQLELINLLITKLGQHCQPTDIHIAVNEIKQADGSMQHIQVYDFNALFFAEGQYSQPYDFNIGVYGDQRMITITDHEGIYHEATYSVKRDLWFDIKNQPFDAIHRMFNEG